jgi:hypothetical protein
MEVQARVPAGGIGCPIPVARMPADTSARAGEPSRAQITIENPFACDLRDVRLQDFMLLDGPGALRVNAVSNGVASTGSDKGRILDWNLGTIPRGGRRTVSADVTATAGDSSIVDETVVQATCGLDDGQRGSTRQVDVPLSGHTTSNVPVSAARSSHILGR